MATIKTSETLKAANFPIPLVAIIVVVIIYIAATMAGQLLIGLYPFIRGWTSSQANQWLHNSTFAQFSYVLAVEAITLAGLYGFMRLCKLTFADLGLIKPRLRYFAVTLLAYPVYFVLNAAASLAATGLFHLNTNQQQQLGFKSVTSTSDVVLTFISLVILPPIVEEIVMRGFLFGSLKKGMTVVKAAILTSFIFAIAHLQFGSGAPLLWVAAIDTFILSLVLCYIRHKTGNLWAGIGLHALKNCLAFAVLFIFPHFR